MHVLGKNNRTSDLLSRWSGSEQDKLELCMLVENPVWINVDLGILEINPKIYLQILYFVLQELSSVKNCIAKLQSGCPRL